MEAHCSKDLLGKKKAKIKIGNLFMKMKRFGIMLALSATMCGGIFAAGKALKLSEASVLSNAEKSEENISFFSYNIKIPTQIYTPKLLSLIKDGKIYKSFFKHGVRESLSNNKIKLYDKISPSSWKELISPFAPVSTRGTFRGMKGGKCPFCGKQYQGCAITVEELVSSPFLAETICCGHIVYAKSEDMPLDYQARPNHIEAIPHLDGTTYNYEFYIPPGCRNDRKQWFCSGGEVWSARLAWLPKIVMEAASVALYKDDRNARMQLFAIFDRLADVYPGLPLYNREIGNGFALGADRKNYLTRAEYLSEPRPRSLGMPFWYQDSYDEQFLKLSVPLSTGWQDGIMWQAGLLAEAFDIIRNHPDIKEWSQSQYGDKSVFEKRVMKNVFMEMDMLCSSTPPSTHNTTIAWINGAFKFGILMQEEYYLKTALGLIEANIAANYSSDGMNTEGAFNYATMMQPLIEGSWIIKYLTGVDLEEKYPFIQRIRQVGEFPIRTLYNVESMHGDEHGAFFCSLNSGRGNLHPPPLPGKINYAEHEHSNCFPDYGIACLRAGKPGSRLETILDFQSLTSHTHLGKLNLQLFYEGINLLPDIGYAVVSADLNQSPWKEEKSQYHFDLLPIPDPKDYHESWRKMYSKQPQTHCTALIDNCSVEQPMFFRFLSSCPIQFVEAGGSIGKTNHFNRKLMTLTLADGRALALDVFWLQGGTRHDMYMHAPSKNALGSLGPPKETGKATVAEYMKLVQERDIALSFLNKPSRWDMPKEVWQIDWLIQPSQFEPVNTIDRESYTPWKRILHDVKLRVWGKSFGSLTGNAEILSARGPWPSMTGPKNYRLGRFPKVIALKDAMNFIIESRIAQSRLLESTFVHIYEPYNPEQNSVLSSVKIEKETSSGCGVFLETKTGQNISVAVTQDGREFKLNDLQLNGRLGIMSKGALSLLLYDGTLFTTKHFGVNLDRGWRLKLIKVIGDISGNPKESALIVRSESSIPIDKTLCGQMLTVYHKSGRTTGYTIDKVNSIPDNKYRIDLRWNPTFVERTSRIPTSPI
ncbi:MAG: hypothetical protein PHS19_06080, partial [Eubacteriales bacterium]|nr:hypothetical protein [Eubacteriales bacterium]